MKKIFIILTLVFTSFQGTAQCNAFYDGFESGTFQAHWTLGTGYTQSVDTNSPAVGNYSLVHTGTSSHTGGSFATFTSGQPQYISYRIKSDGTTGAHGYVVIGDANVTTNDCVLFTYVTGGNALRFYNGTGQNFPINANQWYHVELQNINYISRTMDVYLDGNLILSGWAFRSSSMSSISQFHIYNLNVANASYDEIIVGATPLTGSVTSTICNNDSIVVNGTVYNANNPSGTEVFVNGGVNGCDSTVTINLTVSPAIDITTNVSGNTVTANESGATYRWLDCDNGNAVINGETSQSFTATVTGNYAVEITVGNCVDTSACENVTVVAVDELSKTNVSVYPNPTNGVFNVITSEQVNITIYNMLGEIVLTNVLNGGTHVLSLNSHPKGVYFVNIQQNESVTTYKMIVK